ncbi:MAG: nucleoside triphosphate pyrophosphohydrolase [Clostridia bacterium]
MKFIHNKLVRDKIPEIIEKHNKTCVFSVLTDDDYSAALDQKLNEEVAEYQESKELEELADILEVVYAITQKQGHTIEELEKIRAEKFASRGGFENKIFLEEVIE